MHMLLLLIPLLLPVNAFAADAQRLVFFDVTVDPKLPEVQEATQQLTAALESELAQNQSFKVIDQGTRNTLLLQKKLSLEDCNKVECRFAMVKAIGFVELMLSADVGKLGNECTVSMKIQSVKDGTIVNSLFETVPCGVKEVLTAIQHSASRIRPQKPQETTAEQALESEIQQIKADKAAKDAGPRELGWWVAILGGLGGLSSSAVPKPEGITITLREEDQFKPMRIGPMAHLEGGYKWLSLGLNYGQVSYEDTMVGNALNLSQLERKSFGARLSYNYFFTAPLRAYAGAEFVRDMYSYDYQSTQAGVNSGSYNDSSGGGGIAFGFAYTNWFYAGIDTSLYLNSTEILEETGLNGSFRALVGLILK